MKQNLMKTFATILVLSICLFLPSANFSKPVAGPNQKLNRSCVINSATPQVVGCDIIYEQFYREGGGCYSVISLSACDVGGELVFIACVFVACEDENGRAMIIGGCD